MSYPTAFVLLKNFSKNGLVKFHGVATSEETAQIWKNAGPSNWFFEHSMNDQSFSTVNPITFERMEKGEIE